MIRCMVDAKKLQKCLKGSLLVQTFFHIIVKHRNIYFYHIFAEKLQYMIGTNKLIN